MLGHHTLSTHPLSALTAAAAATDDTPPLGGRAFSSYYDEYAVEEDEFPQPSCTATPLEDTTATDDLHGSVRAVTPDELDEIFDLAEDWLQSRGPPGQDDEYLAPSLSQSDAEEDELGDGTKPGWFSRPPDQDDEYLKPSSSAPDEEDGEDELGVRSLPFDDLIDDICARAFTEEDEEDEDATGWVAFPPDQNDDAPLAASLTVEQEDDEADTGTVSSPLDEPAADAERAVSVFAPDEYEDFEEYQTLAAPVRDECEFPSVQTSSSGSSAFPTFAITLPSGIASGDLCLLLLCSPQDDADFTYPAGWTEAYNETDETEGYFSVAYRFCSGGETSINVDNNAAGDTESLWHAYRISGATSLELAGALDQNGSPNPPNLAPSWGSEKVLWFAAGSATSGNAPGWPANYPVGLQNSNGNIRLVSTQRATEAASEDPGAYSMASGGSHAVTVGVLGVCSGDDSIVPRSIVPEDQDGDGAEETTQASPSYEACEFPFFSTSQTQFTSSSTTIAINTPASGTLPGDLFIASISADPEANLGGVTWPAGWISLGGDTGNQFAYKICTGDDPDTEATIGIANACETIVIRIRGASHGSPIISSVASGTSSSPNPPNAASLPLDKNFWIAWARADGSFTGTPSNYTNQFTVVFADEIRVATRKLVATSEDPGTFSLSSSVAWKAVTIGIAPRCIYPEEPISLAVVDTGTDTDDDFQETSVTSSPLEDAVAADTDRCGSAFADDEPEDDGELPHVTGQPLEDAVAADTDRCGSAFADDDVEEDEELPLIVGQPLEDEPAAPPPAPAPTIPQAGGGGWWIAKAKRKPLVWPNLPPAPEAPPWRTKVVQPRDARLRIAQNERNWKNKMRRARRAEDIIILQIIAELLKDENDA